MIAAVWLLLPALLLEGGVWCQRFVYNYEQPQANPSPAPVASPPSPRVQYAAEQYKEFNREFDYDGDSPPRTRQTYVQHQSPQVSSAPRSSPSFTFEEVYQQFLKNVPAPETSWFSRQPNIVQIQPRQNSWNNEQQGFQNPSWNPGNSNFQQTPRQDYYSPQQNYWQNSAPQQPQNYWQNSAPQQPQNNWQNSAPQPQHNSWHNSAFQQPQNYWQNSAPQQPQNYWQNSAPQQPQNYWQNSAPQQQQNYWQDSDPQQQQNYLQDSAPQPQPQRQNRRQNDDDSDAPYNAAQAYWDSVREVKKDQGQPRGDQWSGVQDVRPRPRSSTPAPYQPPMVTPVPRHRQPPPSPARRPASDRRQPSTSARRAPQPAAAPERRPPQARRTPPVASQTSDARGPSEPRPANLAVADLPVDEDGDEIPGRAGKDYPTLHVIPKTSFSCTGRPQGYYADTETSCQVMHLCQSGGVQSSFLCPNGTIFSQEQFSCQWWYKSDCSTAPSFYSLNDNLYKLPDKQDRRP